MLGRKGAFDDVCGTVGYKLFDLRIRFDADDYAACDIVCHCILSVVLKDSTMTMILSLLLFGGPLLIEWGGVPIVHYLSLNSLLDGHQILQGNWLVLISEIVIFWGALSFAAGYVLYRAYENRR